MSGRMPLIVHFGSAAPGDPRSATSSSVDEPVPQIGCEADQGPGLRAKTGNPMEIAWTRGLLDLGRNQPIRMVVPRDRSL
jgi:hypothetical protein